MNLYELNKQGYMKLPELPELQLRQEMKKIRHYLSNNKDKYFMLLSAEGRDYTVFTFKGERKYKDMCEEIICLLKERGKIKSIEVQENGIDFWIVNPDEECYMFKLFSYDWGVITV